MYVYQWRAGATDLFDAGLLRPDGSERPSYAAFAAGMRALPAKAAPRPGVTWRRVVVEGAADPARDVRGRAVPRHGHRPPAQHGTQARSSPSARAATRPRR